MAANNDDSLQSLAAIGALIGVAFLMLRGSGGRPQVVSTPALDRFLNATSGIARPGSGGMTGGGSSGSSGGNSGGGSSGSSGGGLSGSLVGSDDNDPISNDLPTGGDDPLSNAAREYYDTDYTANAPFGAVGQAEDRVDQINNGDIVGL